MLKVLMFLLLFPFAAMAENHPPEPPEGGITFTYQTACTDLATQEKGYCYVGHDKDGNYYVTFWQDDKLINISKVVGDDVEVIWMDDHFASY